MRDLTPAILSGLSLWCTLLCPHSFLGLAFRCIRPDHSNPLLFSISVDLLSVWHTVLQSFLLAFVINAHDDHSFTSFVLPESLLHSSSSLVVPKKRTHCETGP